MEFRILKKDLVKALDRTLSVVERRNTMPSLNHALFELKDESLQISATDLEIFVTSNVPCKTLTQGRIAIPPRHLSDIIRGWNDDESIHFKAFENNSAEIKSGDRYIKLLGLPADSFPHFKTSPKGQLSSGHLNRKMFLDLIDKTEHSICTEEIRYFLTGIYLERLQENGKTTLRTVSTDGHRLSLMEVDEDVIGRLEIKKGLIIPKKGAQELKKLLEGVSSENFEITCDENLIRANVGPDSLWVRPIDGEYPDYRRVIPSKLPHVAKISKKELVQSLKIMLALVSERSKVVTFEFNKNQLVLSTNNPDKGEASDRIAMEYDGADMKTGFNVNFFIDAVSNLEGDEIEIEVGEKLQPALLKSAQNPGYLIVIMPMRI